jgi:hypothetical protein
MPATPKHQSLFIYVLGGLFVVLYFCFSALCIYYTPRHPALFTHVGFFQVMRDAHNLPVVALLFLLLVLTYSLYFFFVRLSGVSRGWFGTVIIFTVVFVAILIIAPPFMSADLYGYIYRSMAVSTAHINPYVIPPSATAFASITPWSAGVMPYGPLFTTYGILLQRVSGLSLAANLVTFRMLNVVLFFLCALVIYKILRINKPEFSRQGVALFLWNPFILIEVINNGHNDIMMLLFILLSIYFLFRKNVLMSVLMLAFGFLIKYVTIFLLPIPVILVLCQKIPIWQKVKKIAFSLVTFLAVCILFYAPYGSLGLSTKNLGGGFFAVNQVTFPRYIVQSMGNFFSKATTGAALSGGQMHWLYLVVLTVLLAGIYFVWYRKEKNSFGQQYFWILLLVIHFITMNFNIWYIIWFLPLVLIIPNQRYLPLLLFSTVYGFLVYIVLRTTANYLFWGALLVYGAVLGLRIMAKKYNFLGVPSTK